MIKKFEDLKDLIYLKTKKTAEILSKTKSLINQLGGFIHYLKQSEYKGSKLIWSLSLLKCQIPNSKL